jgi:two-component system OmpR family response regulator
MGTSYAYSNKRILVVDDEDAITELVATAARFAGFELATAASGREALERAAVFLPHLIVLDIMMPVMDGFEVLRVLRARGDLVPIIFLTAKDEHAAKLRGLTSGADDYVTKPFSLEELMARIRAVLRRSADLDGITTGRYTVADLVLDETAYEVLRGDRVITLSPTEFRLLRYMMTNAGKALSRDQILSHVWHSDYAGEGSIVETYISYLRRKIDEGATPLIHTVRGYGYTLRAPTDQAP